MRDKKNRKRCEVGVKQAGIYNRATGGGIQSKTVAKNSLGRSSAEQKTAELVSIEEKAVGRLSKNCGERTV